MEEKRHYKLYKSGKNWVVAAVAAFTVLSGSGLASTALNVHAATPRVSATAKAARQAASDNLYKQIRWAQAYKASNYTASSFAALQNALNAGLKIFRNQNGKTTAQLNAATAAMHNAALKLVKATPAAANVAALQTQLGWSTKYMQGANDDAALFTTLKADIATAQGYVADPSKASQSAVDSIAAALKKDGQAILDSRAKQVVATPADFSSLNFALKLATAPSVIAANYTPASWTPFAAALANAQKVAAVSTSLQPAVQSATTNLIAAQQALVSAVGNSAALANAISDAQTNFVASDYTAAAYATFSTVIANAVAVNNNPAATTQQIAQAIATLKSAEATLGQTSNIMPTNVTALNNAIIAANKLVSTDYSNAATVWGGNGELANAQEFLGTGKTQSQVNAELATLNKAVTALTPVAVPAKLTKALNDAIAVVPSQPAGVYTTTSYKAYTDALSAAKAIAANPSALVSNVVKAYNALTIAQTATGSAAAQYKADGTSDATVTGTLTVATNATVDQALFDAVKTAATNYNLATTTVTGNNVPTGAVKVTINGTGKDMTVTTTGSKADKTVGVKGDYTAASWLTFVNALSAVQSAEGQNYTSTAVDALVQQLTSAEAGLVANTLDTSSLAKAIKSAQNLTASDYTTDSYAKLTKEISNAQSILGSAKQQSQIDAETALLTTAAGNLVIDPAALATAVTLAGQADTKFHSLTLADYADTAQVSAAEQTLVGSSADVTTVAGAKDADGNSIYTATAVAGVLPSKISLDANALLGFIQGLKTKGVADTFALTQTLQALAGFTPASTVAQDKVAAYNKALGVVQADLNNTTTGLASQFDKDNTALKTAAAEAGFTGFTSASVTPAPVTPASVTPAPATPAPATAAK